MTATRTISLYRSWCFFARHANIVLFVDERDVAENPISYGKDCGVLAIVRSLRCWYRVTCLQGYEGGMLAFLVQQQDASNFLEEKDLLSRLSRNGFDVYLSLPHSCLCFDGMVALQQNSNRLSCTMFLIPFVLGLGCPLVVFGRMYLLISLLRASVISFDSDRSCCLSPTTSLFRRVRRRSSVRPKTA